MDIWTFLNPILKLGFYLSVVGTVGTALFFFHFKKILEKQNVEFCKNLMFFSSGFGLIICLLFFISLAGNFGGSLTSIFNIMFLTLAFKTTVGQVALLTAFAHAVVCIVIFGVNLFAKVILVLCTTGIILSFAIVGHSSTKGYLAQFLLLIHLIGISYWIGSFIPLRQLCKSSNYNTISNVAHKFGVYALFYLGLLIISGITYSLIMLGDISNIFSTSYGLVLFMKFILVNILLLLGALNKFKYVPMIKTDPKNGVNKLYFSINFEIFLTIIVFSLTSLLTTSFMLPMYN